MVTRMIKELEGKAIRSEADFHSALALALDFPGHYGRNLDALWDVLTSDVERPVVLVWKDAQASQAALGDRFEAIIGLMRRVEKQDAAWGLAEKFELLLN